MKEEDEEEEKKKHSAKKKKHHQLYKNNKIYSIDTVSNAFNQIYPRKNTNINIVLIAIITQQLKMACKW